MKNLNNILPVFPLNGAILLPQGNLPLNIFEERYIEMIDYSLSKNKKISRSFEDFLFNNFGKTLYSIYFGKYNKKIWKIRYH